MRNPVCKLGPRWSSTRVCGQGLCVGSLRYRGRVLMQCRAGALGLPTFCEHGSLEGDSSHASSYFCCRRIRVMFCARFNRENLYFFFFGEKLCRSTSHVNLIV